MSELASPPSGAATPPRPIPHARAEARTPDVTVVPAQQPAGSDPPADEAPNSAGTATTGTTTTAGAVLGGRYRLRTRVGSDAAAGAEFWQAQDVVLQRDVALTILRRLGREDGAVGGDDDPTGSARADQMVLRALRAGSFEHGACARLLDVLAPGTAGVPADVLGAAVTEWVPGTGLAEAVAGGLIKPLAAARAVAPLAAAAEEAHRYGLVLGCDHPQRVRITPDGRARLSFALPRPDSTPADDVRGLGGVLYALLTSRWPLSGADAARAGLAAADRTTAGALVPPSAQRPGVPVELDTLTAGTLGPVDAPGHIHTAAAVHRLLAEVVEEDDRIALFPPAHDGVPSGPGDVWQDSGKPPPPVDPKRRRRLVLGLIGLLVAVVLVLGYVGSQVGSLFVDGSGGPVIRVDGAPVAPSDEPPQPGSTGVGGVVAVAGAEVYDKVGDRDNAGRVSRVLDGNRDSGWSTVNYRQQFPALKPGIGVMVSFASAVQLAELTIDSPSPGTVVEVRSAPSADAAFDETEKIGEATLSDGATKVSLDGSQPVSHVLLWITQLGGGGSEWSSQLDEIEFRRAG